MKLTEALALPRLRALLHSLPGKTIGVVGDLGLDAYWYADMTISVISRETPLFPRPVIREEYSPGAGANVAHNLADLGVGRVIAFSVLGDDWRGQILRREMATRRIERILEQGGAVSWRSPSGTQEAPLRDLLAAMELDVVQHRD